MTRNHHEEVATMTPEQRRTAFARILATGVLRLQARPALVIAEEPPPDSQNSERTRPLFP